MKRQRLKQASKCNKRNRILEAAIAVFAHQGYECTTISDIASKAGIANGTIYLYYKSKADLFVSAMYDLVKSNLDEIRSRLLCIENPVERLIGFVESHVEILRLNPEAARCIVVEMRKSELFLEQNPSYDPFGDYLDYVTEICSEAISSGLIRILNPRTLALMVVGIMDFVLMQWVNKKDNIDLDTIVEEIRLIFRHGVLEKN